MHDGETWLRDWHARHAGATARAMAHGRPSSYDWLAALPAPTDRVLDLACGDGHLMELIRTRGVADLVGLDMSEAELALARARLGPDATLVQGRAQQLPFPDASFDLITCHLALMLMRPVEPVIDEARRVLGPGGRFAAVVGHPTHPPRDDAWNALVRRCVALPLEAIQLGDPRTSAPEPLGALLSPFAEVHITPLAVDLSGPPEQVWSLFHLTYLHELIPQAHLAEFESAAHGTLQSMIRSDGTVSCTLDLLAIEAKK